MAKKKGRAERPSKLPPNEKPRFTPRFPHKPGVHGVPRDVEAEPSPPIESICGGIDDSQPVEQYDGTLGVTIAFVNAHQRPVGQLQWNSNLASIYDDPGNVSGVRWCSGTLIANDLFLTAGHCFDQTGGPWRRPRVNGSTNIIPPSEIATNMHVNFNFQVDADGNLRTEESFAITALVEYRLDGLDFAVCRLAGNPGAAFGLTAVSPTDAAVNDMLCIIQHPAGLPKRIEAGPLSSFDDVFIEYDDIDTLGGTSGAGILGPAGTIVGVHTNGGCDSAAFGNNHGVRISSIISASPTVRSVMTPKLKVADDPITFKFLDDPGAKSKFQDDPIKLKFQDDPRPTLKFIDDPFKLKFSDDGGAGGTNPFLDPVKTPGLDKSPLTDFRFLGGGFRGSQASEAAPFVLSTPHHSSAWSQSYPEAYRSQQRHYEEAIQLCQQALQQAQQACAQRPPNPQEAQQLVEQLQQELTWLSAEYQRLFGAKTAP